MEEQEGLKSRANIRMCRDCEDFNPSYAMCKRLRKETADWFKCSI